MVKTASMSPACGVLARAKITRAGMSDVRGTADSVHPALCNVATFAASGSEMEKVWAKSREVMVKTPPMISSTGSNERVSVGSSHAAPVKPTAFLHRPPRS